MLQEMRKTAYISFPPASADDDVGVPIVIASSGGGKHSRCGVITCLLLYGSRDFSTGKTINRTSINTKKTESCSENRISQEKLPRIDFNNTLPERNFKIPPTVVSCPD